MDPLSIIASSVAVAHAIRVTVQKIRNISHVTAELLALSNEISDLTVILNAVRVSLRSRIEGQNFDHDAAFIQSLLSLQRRLEVLAQEISTWSATSLKSKQTREAGFIPLARIDAKAKRFKEEFQSLRSKIHDIAAAAAVVQGSRVELDLQEIRVVTQGAAAGQSQLEGVLQTSHGEQRRLLESLVKSVNNLHTSVRSGVSTSSQSEAESGIVTPESSNGETDYHSKTVKAFLHNGSVLFESAQMTSVSAVGIRTAQFPRISCTPWCSCVCHTAKRLSTPSFMERLVGSLFISYSGMPMQRQKCDEQSCHLATLPGLYVTYFFPMWFLARMVSFTLFTTPMAGPVASLKVQRVVPGDAEIFMCATQGDVGRMKFLFENGLASPHDVSYRSGITALHLAISHKQIDACRLLLQANADPFLEDRSSWSAADNAWTKILSKRYPPQAEGELRLMFSNTECIERRDFTVLHRIVLGLVGNDLEAHLRASTKEIDTVDTSGRTALSFAAERCDIPAMTLLLNYGADPNIGSATQGSPLHAAAIALEPTALRLLLSHGAGVDSKTSHDQTSLTYVAAYTHDVRHADLLIAAGANVNVRDLDGMTPLTWAVVSGNTEVAARLLLHGAFTKNRDYVTGSVFEQCVKSNRHDIARLLLEHDPSLREVSLPGESSLLHTIAVNADVEMMDLLRPIQIVSSDSTDSHDEIYLNVVQAVQDRTDASLDLERLFKSLLTPFEATSSFEIKMEQDDDDTPEIWEEALENPTA